VPEICGKARGDFKFKAIGILVYYRGVSFIVNLLVILSAGVKKGAGISAIFK
jgi:hypothetical protein